ncbi:MAG TPA: Calx-beta domain-containing protein [Acidimicrobiales bacterium]|nr:Calx-beta domain-containing protein [Acidimicrobiales bacterium]
MTRLHSRRWTTIAAALAAVVAVLGGVAVFAGADSGSNGGSGDRPLIITAEVERRTLTDDVTLQGTVGRVEQRQIDAVDAGRISAVHVDDGATVEAGQPILSIDGRDAIAATGDFPFYRPLEVGSQGNDVRQLEQILRDAGYSPGAVDTSFTDETHAALASWQAARGYPGATPEQDESYTISLSPGGGYTVGDQSSAAVIIGQSKAAPGSKAAVAKVAGAKIAGTVTIQALDATVAEGSPARFRVSAGSNSHPELDIALAVGGTADDADIVVPTGEIVLPADTWSVDVSVVTRQDDLVERDETIEVSVVDGDGFDVDGTEATTTIVSEDVPELRLTGGGSVAEGDVSEIEIVADQAPIKDVQVALAFTGDAVAGDDYVALAPVAVLRAGADRQTITLTTLLDETLEGTERIVVSIGAGTGAYRVGRTATAVTTIDRVAGAAALPTLTLRPTATHVGEGQPIPMTLALSRAITDDLVVSLVYGGDAGLGTDYTPMPGRVIVAAGLTSLALQVPTVQDDVVEADRTLTVTIGSLGTYVVGSPASGTVTIESDDVPELTLLGGVSRLAEGSGTGFTFVADQAPIHDISVAYSVVGSATPGQDVGALTGVAILPAGETTLTVPITTLDDDVVFRPTDLIVGAWPIRIGQVLVDEGETVPPGTPLLSLVDTGLTVTLRASASDRTKLEPGQKATVKLTGSSEQVEGTISELDETATVDEATGEQFYEGKIEVGDLPGADGATVSIEVVLDQRVDAITVPIAAVKQDGDGNDVVRIIDLEDTGEVSELQVVTGIAEGSYIEIREGLDGGEVVIVEVETNE